MDVTTFFALRTGAATQTDGLPATLTVHDVGTLRVPSGLVRACDPFMSLEDGPVFVVPAGDHPVRVTIADVSPAQDGSHLREAYLTLVVADGTPATATYPDAHPEGPAPEGEAWGVGVDTGTVALVDLDALTRCMPADPRTWYDEVVDHAGPDSWFNRMEDAVPRAGMADIVLPSAPAGENVVMTRSGWGDGFYPVVVTHDTAGRLLGLHIDLRVVGEVVA